MSTFARQYRKNTECNPAQGNGSAKERIKTQAAGAREKRNLAAAVIVFIYLSFKVINSMPKRMENIRNAGKEAQKADEIIRTTDIADKIGPKVDIWVMEKRYCRTDLTIKEVAQEIGTNQNYLSAYLNRYKNTNFQLWLNTLRIEESKKLMLSDKHLSIEEIGAKVGIPQNYNFSKWFKTITEMTPYQYKKTQLKR